MPSASTKGTGLPCTEATRPAGGGPARAPPWRTSRRTRPGPADSSFGGYLGPLHEVALLGHCELEALREHSRSARRHVSRAHGTPARWTARRRVDGSVDKQLSRYFVGGRVRWPKSRMAPSYSLSERPACSTPPPSRPRPSGSGRWSWTSSAGPSGSRRSTPWSVSTPNRWLSAPESGGSSPGCPQRFRRSPSWPTDRRSPGRRAGPASPSAPGTSSSRTPTGARSRSP
jgi:hypothetical protein